MPDLSFDIESIVKQVLAEIQAGAGDGVCTLAAAQPKPTEPKSAGAVSQLAVSSKVVSLAEVEGRLEGIAQLVVPRGAVVTPSVRDLLREKNIALTFSTGKVEEAADAQSSGIRLSLVEALVKPSLRFDLASLGRGLRSDGIDVDESTFKCLIETTDRFAALVDDGPSIGAIITSHPAPGLCLANRLDGVRAIGPATVADVARDAKGIGANLIVINPAGRGIFQIRQMLREFCQGGPYDCPSALVERLK